MDKQDTQDTQEYKPVHFFISDPAKSIFKDRRNRKAKSEVVECKMSHRCELYKNGQCSYIAFFGWQRCPYGYFKQEGGYTKAAKKYHKWIKEQKDQYSNVPMLKSHKKILRIVGDYVFLPYAHITMCEEVPFLAHGGFMRRENVFVPRDSFTVKNVIKLINFRPKALSGGEIIIYQKKEVPKFIQHLSEHEGLKEIWNAVYDQSDKVKSIYDNIQKQSNVDRTALLKTLNPNVGTFKNFGTSKDEWVWDGEFLTCTNIKPFYSVVDEVEESLIRIKPKDNASIKVTDNDQVNENTEFLD